MARAVRAEFSDRTKAEVYVRDRAMCCYTGASLWLLDYGGAPAVPDTVDHVELASKGGSNDAGNGVLCNSLSNFSRGNQRPRGFIFFDWGLPDYNAFVVYGTIPTSIMDHIKRFTSLHYSDWYLNRAIMGIRLAAVPLEKQSRIDGKPFVRGREYYRKVALKRLNQWRAIVASEQPGSLADRGLLPPKIGPDHQILLEGLEAKSLADVAATAKKFEPYLTASCDALDGLFGQPSKASLRQHMERVQRDPHVVERIKRGVVEHIRWLLSCESAK